MVERKGQAMSKQLIEMFKNSFGDPDNDVLDQLLILMCASGEEMAAACVCASVTALAALTGVTPRDVADTLFRFFPTDDGWDESAAKLRAIGSQLADRLAEVDK